MEDGSGSWEEQEDPDSVAKTVLPQGVEVYEITGPFFCGVADRLNDALRQVEPAPGNFHLRIRKVPTIVATGMHALERSGFFDDTLAGNVLENIDLARARELLESH